MASAAIFWPIYNIFGVRYFSENGTASYETILLGNVTINVAENEIDRSQETETESSDAEDGRGSITESTRPGITLAQPPRTHNSQGSVWGPFFEDGAEPLNITAKLGTTVLLNCTIGLLYDKTVSPHLKEFNILGVLRILGIKNQKGSIVQGWVTKTALKWSKFSKLGPKVAKQTLKVSKKGPRNTFADFATNVKVIVSGWPDWLGGKGCCE